MERWFRAGMYREMIAIPDRSAELVELIEIPSCPGGAHWVMHQFQRSDLVLATKMVSNQYRYLLKAAESKLKPSTRFPALISRVEIHRDEVAIEYSGLGGARYMAALRSRVPDLVEYDPAGNTITLRSRSRILIGIDDTDTKSKGATWALGHWLGCRLNKQRWRYLSHTIVQLYPVKYRTQNCVACCLEFGCLDAELIPRFKELLLSQSLSEHTGMVAFQGLDPSKLLGYGLSCKRRPVTMDEALQLLEQAGAWVGIRARGAIGAGASIPFYTDYPRAHAFWC